MAKTEVKVSSGNLSTLGLLGIVFVVLKLCGVVGWSWWWVTAPFWGGVVLAAAFMALMLVGAILVALFK